jgi:hypothetical protein
MKVQMLNPMSMAKDIPMWKMILRKGTTKWEMGNMCPGQNHMILYPMNTNEGASSLLKNHPIRKSY